MSANKDLPGVSYDPPLIADLSEATAIKLALQNLVLAQERQCKKYEVGSPVRVALEAEKSKIQSLLIKFGG